MKKIFTLCIVFLSLICHSQTITTLDNDNGFRNVHFGDSIFLHPTMKAFYYTPDSQFVSYRKSDDSLIVANSKVDIIYTFYKGQLFGIMIKSLDETGSKNILKSLHESYGKSKKPDPYIESYYWYAKSVILEYHQNMVTEKADIFINSIKMRLKWEGRDY